MNCLRCGRETSGQQVFCDTCLDDMARHPVKPDVAIYLPVRKPKELPRKQSHRWRRERSAEETVVILRRRVRVLAVITGLLILMLAAAVTGVWIARQQGADLPIPNIGQNYQTAGANNASLTGD